MSRMRVEADISISVICINIESNVTVFQSVAYSIYLNISVSQDFNLLVLVSKSSSSCVSQYLNHFSQYLREGVQQKKSRIVGNFPYFGHTHTHTHTHPPPLVKEIICWGIPLCIT